VVVANSFHVTALGDVDHCASTLARSFIATRSPGDTACAKNIPEVRLVPSFATGYVQLPAATAGPGNQAPVESLQAVTAAVLSAGDALGRWWVNYDGSGVGLRGGHFRYAYRHHGYAFTLSSMRFVDDIAVSGHVNWSYGTGVASAHLTLRGYGVPTGTLDVSWNDLQANAIASVTGTLSGKNVVATLPAP
jgi:hypothetical protein